MDFFFLSVCITVDPFAISPSCGLFVFFIVDGTEPHLVVIVAIAVTDGFKDDLMLTKTKSNEVMLELECSHVTAEPSKT